MPAAVVPTISTGSASEMYDGRADNGCDQLTSREAEVAALVSQGLANKAVARKLGVSEGTVKLHLNNIYRKLRVPNRIGLILIAMAKSPNIVPWVFAVAERQPRQALREPPESSFKPRFRNAS
jgi:DNA-binding NarL/FixJ family response regulator